MLKIRRRSENGWNRKSTAEGVARAFTVATQMALLSPPGVDEWVRQELGGEPTGAGRGRQPLR